MNTVERLRSLTAASAHGRSLTLGRFESLDRPEAFVTVFQVRRLILLLMAH